MSYCIGMANESGYFHQQPNGSHLHLEAMHIAINVRAYGAHLYFPHAPQKSRHAASATHSPHVMPFAETARAP